MNISQFFVSRLRATLRLRALLLIFSVTLLAAARADEAVPAGRVPAGLREEIAWDAVTRNPMTGDAVK